MTVETVNTGATGADSSEDNLSAATQQPPVSPASSASPDGEALVNNIVNNIVIPDDTNEFTASSGVVLKLKRVNRLVIVEAAKRIPEPSVPEVFIEDKGRKEPNPNDPKYLAALQDANYTRGMATINVALALGTEVLTVPEGMQHVSDTQWAEDLEFLGFEISPVGSKARYLQWLKYHALTDEELNALAARAARNGGVVMQEDVAKATVAFPSNAERDADSGDTATGQS